MVKLDHIVIRVNDLAAAIADYRSLGFNVVPGGEHPGFGSKNALIPFHDGSYLELIAFDSGPADPSIPKVVRAAQLAAEGRSPVEQRVMPWASCDEGLVDWAVVPDDIDANIAGARERGLLIEGPFPGSRLRPDGQTIAWQFGVPDGYDLPFLCADVTDRSSRVPMEFVQHDNGVVGIEKVYVAANRPRETIERAERLLGIEHAKNRADFTLGSTTVVVSDHAIELIAPHLAAVGEGPLALNLQRQSKGRRTRLDPDVAHGAALYVC